MSKDGSHYTRATGRLSKAPYGIYSDSRTKDNDSSTIYSLEEKSESNKQYPLGCLTSSQRMLITEFMSGLCGKDSIELNDFNRAIHFVGEWRSKESGITVTCTVVQPHITNAIVHIKGVLTSAVMAAREDYVAVVGGSAPNLNTITTCPQPQGYLAVPFTDYMLERKVISLSNISWSNIVFSKTQLVFVVIMKNSAYECVLTHTSCNIMSKLQPPDAEISPPNSKSQSYSFRRHSITRTPGSGPSITVHTSGTMQFQGGAGYVKSVTSNFRNCIDHILTSKYAQKFISSLGIIRDVSSFMPEM